MKSCTNVAVFCGDSLIFTGTSVKAPFFIAIFYSFMCYLHDANSVINRRCNTYIILKS